MKIPETLYNLYRTQRSGVRPAFESGKESISQAAYNVTTDLYVVPQEYMLILSNLVIELNGGSGQKVDTCYVNIYPPQGAPILLLGQYYWNAHGSELLNWQGELYLESKSVIEVTGVFDVNTNPNQVMGHLQGMLIPEMSV